jgi:glyoxylase-like metal-dependent hydrolase (beta-lactamase superfamily II)
MIKITNYGPVTRFDLARSLPGRGRYWTTAYGVDGMLVDTGCAHTAAELARALAGTSLFRITNTHTHEDHIGADGRLQREREGLEILAHPLALPVLADPRGEQPLHPYRRFFWGWPEPAKGRAVQDGELIETEHYRFQVFFTPGHAEDHLCLYEPKQGWLFSGDLFVGGRDRALRAGTNIGQVIASLKRIACLPADWLFPGSARVRQKPEAEIAAKIEYLEALGQRVLDLHRQGRSVSEIASAICGRPMGIEFITLGHFTRKQLVLSYLISVKAI